MKSTQSSIVMTSQVVGAKVTPLEIGRIQRLVDLGEYLGVSDFVREAVREKLDAIDVVELRDISYKTAKKEVLGYLERYREAYPYEAANALGIELKVVHQIVNELIAEKRLEVIS